MIGRYSDRQAILRSLMRRSTEEVVKTEREAQTQVTLSWNWGDIEMPFSFDVDESAGVFHIQAIGEVNDAEVRELSDRLRREVAFVAGYPILCDCSKLTTVLLSASLIESLARAARSRTNVIAIIAPRSVAFGLARMFQIYSDPEDTRIYVFTNRAEAMEWLETRVKGLVTY